MDDAPVGFAVGLVVGAMLCWMITAGIMQSGRVVVEEWADKQVLHQASPIRVPARVKHLGVIYRCELEGPENEKEWRRVFGKDQEVWDDAAAAGVELVAEEMMKELGLTEEDSESAMEPVREFAGRIRDGEVTLAQAITVGEELVEGPAFAVLLTRGFEGKYLAGSELSEEEKQEGHVTLTRFAKGVSAGKIPATKAEEVSQIVTVETTDEDGETTEELKATITLEELKTCLKIMKDSADAVGVEDKEFAFDLGEEIRKVISRAEEG